MAKNWNYTSIGKPFHFSVPSQKGKKSTGEQLKNKVEGIVRSPYNNGTTLSGKAGEVKDNC